MGPHEKAGQPAVSDQGDVTHKVERGQMTTADGPRTGHGFARLRKRYIRRAGYLTTNKGYLDRITAERRIWDESFPRYRLGPGNPIGKSGLPANLERDYNDRMAWYERHRPSDDQTAPPESAKDALEDLLEEQERRRKYKEVRAHDRWFEMVTEVVDAFFPLEDFPNPYLDGPHPARSFVCATMGTDPRLLGNCERFFDDFTLEIVDLGSYDPDTQFMEIESDRNQAWYLRLYPGITDADLRDSAPEIVRRVNDLYGTRTPYERIATLHANGLSRQAIANQLGLTLPTVSANIKAITGEITENA